MNTATSTHALTRRTFLALAAQAAAACATQAAASPPARRPISFFSKQLHWLTPAEAAKVAAEIGFEGLDLTVRPMGHVLPERVEEDLPKAVESARAAGIRIDSIVTAIASPDEPHAEKVLRTAAKLGVKTYRTGWHKYGKNGVAKSLEEITTHLRALADLNKACGIRGGVQNHAGTYFAAPVWDLWLVLKDIGSEWLGSQYDVRHAVAEGSGSWTAGLDLIMPHIHTLNFKDFAWKPKDGKTIIDNVPLGEGMVPFKQFLKLLSGPAASAPVILHSEYLPEKAPSGDTLPRDEVFAAIKKDLATLRALLG